MALVCSASSENEDRMEAEGYKGLLGEDYRSTTSGLAFTLTTGFIQLDQLCLMKPIDAMNAIANGHLDGLLPTEEDLDWRSRSRRKSQDSQSQQCLFLLQTFVNFGSEAQLQRLLKRWNYAEKLDYTWSDNGGTVLMEASIRGRDRIVKLLCEFGATVDLVSSIRMDSLTLCDLSQSGDGSPSTS